MILKQMVQQILVRIIRWRGFRLHPINFKVNQVDGLTKPVCVRQGIPRDPTIPAAAKGWRYVSDPIRNGGLHGSLETKKVFVVA
jgi:hypothetical protein